MIDNWNKALFFFHTHWYVWLNNCGMGKPWICIMCFYLVINEVFALCPQLINFLRSNNTTLSSLLLSHFASELRVTVLDLFNSWGNISTHVLRKVRNVSIRVSFYIFEPQENILIYGPRKIPVYINTYYTQKPQGNRLIHITRKLHI